MAAFRLEEVNDDCQSVCFSLLETCCVCVCVFNVDGAEGRSRRRGETVLMMTCFAPGHLFLLFLLQFCKLPEQGEYVYRRAIKRRALSPLQIKRS